MNLRSSAVVGAGVIAATLILGVTLPQRAFPTQEAQKPAPQPEVQVGRFQLATLQGSNQNSGKVFVVDTTNGQVWEQVVDSLANVSDKDFLAPKLKKP
jgi:hypothetical protein